MLQVRSHSQNRRLLMNTQQTGKIALPKPIAAYFTADTVDATAVALCFTENAVVIDEGKSHVGRDAIHGWKEGKATKYSYISEPFAIRDEGGKTIVTSHVSGNFPGNKIDLRYIFKLDGVKIAQLEI